MAERKLKRIVRYGNVSSDYLERRQLRKGIGFWQLWGVGVGVVISGMLSGWNEGLGQGGFWGMAIGTILMATMYLFMTFSMAELSAALPNAGGFYAFTRTAFGPVAGFLCGFAALVEYLGAYSVALYYLGDLINGFLPFIPEPIIWALVVTIFITVNVLGTDWALKVNLGFTIVAVGMVLMLILGILLSGNFDPQLLLTIQPDPTVSDASNLLPKGAKGLLSTLPYAIWFYLAIEMMPQTAEEAKDAPQELPRAMIASMLTLIALSIGVLVLNSGIPVQIEEGGEILKGAVALAASGQPFEDGINVVFGDSGVLRQILALGSILANFAGTPVIVFAYSRLFFAMSRAGYLHQAISVTNDRGIPVRGAIFGGVICFILTSLFVFVGGEESDAGLAMLTTSIAAGVVTYILVMSSYIQIKLSRSSLPRPYRSPVGVFGAFVGLMLAVIAFISCFAIESYRLSVYCVVVLMIAATVYFFLVGRNQVVAEAPEEKLDLADDSMFFPS